LLKTPDEEDGPSKERFNELFGSSSSLKGKREIFYLVAFREH
jgi:hypothetical protein